MVRRGRYNGVEICKVGGTVLWALRVHAGAYGMLSYCASVTGTEFTSSTSVNDYFATRRRALGLPTGDSGGGSSGGGGRMGDGFSLDDQVRGDYDCDYD